LPTTRPFFANLAALWAHDQKLAAAIEALDSLHSYRVEPSKAGVPTLAMPTDDGKTIQLHSRYQPLEEAARLIDPLPLDECVAFHVHGFGLGYHVEQLFERSSDEAYIFVMEQDLLAVADGRLSCAIFRSLSAAIGSGFSGNRTRPRCSAGSRRTRRSSRWRLKR
jgi:hypothetical protein